MGDSTTAKIDRFFNVVDATLDETSKIIGRASQSGKTAGRVMHDAGQAVREAREANPRANARSAKPPMPPPPRSGVSRSSKVRIIESTDAQTGAAVFVVTNGVSRSECSSRALAETVARAMEVE